MLRSSLIAASSVILCATGSAQQQATPQQVPGPVKDAGILHMATGTWTRATTSAGNIGPDIIYKNDADSGYFATTNVGFENTDEGRIPAANGSIAGATLTEYTVNCFQFGYCSDVPNTAVTLNFYESYNPCDDVQAPASCLATAATFNVTGLPGGPTAASCWVVTLDFAGAEFCLEGDGGSCNPGFSGAAATDSFGWGHTFTNSLGQAGPLLSGDPDWTVSTTGANISGGGGTYYDPMTTCADTGLDTQDLFYATDMAGTPPGCYFFGGYKNTNGCGGPSNTPFASFYGVVFADNSLGECVGGGGNPTFCDPGNPNSTGAPAALAGVGNSITGGGVTLNVSSGPPTEFYYHLFSSATTAGTPLSQGLLCLASPQGRYSPATASNGGVPGWNSIGAFDGAGNGAAYNVLINHPNPIGGNVTAGQTVHYQTWYRDGSGFSNLTNGVSVTYTP